MEEAVYADVRELVESHGRKSDEVIAAGRPVSTFTRVDFGEDVNAMSDFVEDVFLKVFKLPALAVRVRSYGIGMSSARGPSHMS